MNTTAYIYKWIHLPTSKWYIGSRTKENCYPGDGYICSSKLVKPLIKSSPNEWHREILATGSPEEIILLESKILTMLDAKNDPNSYNMHNGDGKFTTSGVALTDDWREKISASNTGKKRTLEQKENYKLANQKKAKNPDYILKLKKPKSESHRQKISESLRGQLKTDKHKSALCKSQKLSSEKLRTGKSYSEIFGNDRSKEIRQKMSTSQKGKPCNNPTVVCPHCDKSGPSGAMNRWHFNNCKKK